jgi:hypothetical protein
MDFSKPYEPSASTASSNDPTPNTPRRKSTQPIPALFRKKAA